MLKQIPKLKALVPKVVEWDRKTPHHYVHRWINLHGMGAVKSGLGEDSSTSLSLPKSQWDTIAEKTRQDYLSDFQEAVNSLLQ